MPKACIDSNLASPCIASLCNHAGFGQTFYREGACFSDIHYIEESGEERRQILALFPRALASRYSLTRWASIMIRPTKASASRELFGMTDIGKHYATELKSNYMILSLASLDASSYGAFDKSFSRAFTRDIRAFCKKYRLRFLSAVCGIEWSFFRSSGALWNLRRSAIQRSQACVCLALSVD